MGTLLSGRSGGACEAEKSGGGVKPLGLSNVAGVFLVTMLGCLIAAVFAITEFLYGTRQTAVVGGVGWLQEIVIELKFILSCIGNTKVKLVSAIKFHVSIIYEPDH